MNVDTSSAAPAEPTDALPDVRLLIGGHWIASADRQQLIVTNPANKAAIGTVPIATDGDIEAALRASDRAYPQWRDTSPYERAEIIQRAATLLRERAETIAHAMTLENGKPYWDSLGEVRYTADIMDSMATDGPRRFGHVLPAGAADGRTILVNEPVGPVAAFSPWNYPLTVPGRKLAAAFSAGCTVIIKPAEETPSSAVALAEAFVDAGLPAGVLGLLFGDPAQISSALIASPVIRKVSFTGSTGVGKHIAQLAGSHVKPVMLELGGHAPVIVFDDVDVADVARQAVGAKAHNTGQSCGSPSRFFVHERVYDDFVAEFGRLLGRVVVSDGFDPACEVGPLANARRFDAMGPLVSDAVGRGARVVTGGEGDSSVGYFWPLTLLADVPDDAQIMHEEPFGPLAAVTRFADENDVIERANAVPYGLGAYLFTGSADRALRIPRLLDVGMVTVNKFGVGGRDTFFGGRKESGFGSEGGPEAVEEYMVRKLISQG